MLAALTLPACPFELIDPALPRFSRNSYEDGRTAAMECCRCVFGGIIMVRFVNFVKQVFVNSVHVR